MRVASAAGQRTFWPRIVTAAELESGDDAVVLEVKSDALGQVMDDIAPAAKPPALIIPFLNGIAHLEHLTGRFGPAVLGGVLKIVTQLDDDGTIWGLAPEFQVELGELDGETTERVSRLAAAFRDAGADVTVPADIVGAI